MSNETEEIVGRLNRALELAETGPKAELKPVIASIILSSHHFPDHRGHLIREACATIKQVPKAVDRKREKSLARADIQKFHRVAKNWMGEK
ncbi:hypothetical protein [uncultured Sulfitobacter sp.]|uniref:hypothetical protein n=1 Tax=uncultured Sulfitobacter sp. TaxID=191468 RepID=UPI00260BA8AA|nr:hypothetical protein [uncultured Sulfitobacter sp.]